MRKEQVINLGDGRKPVRVHEFTLQQIRDMIQRQDLAFDPVAVVTGQQELPADLLRMVTDLDPAELPSFTLSELEQVVDGIKEVNASFFGLLQGLANLSGLVAEFQSGASTNAQPA